MQHTTQRSTQRCEDLTCRLEETRLLSCKAGQLLVVRQSARDTPLRVRTTLTGWAAVHCAGLDGSSPGSDVTTTGPGSLHGCREYPAQTHSSSTSFSGLLACASWSGGEVAGGRCITVFMRAPFVTGGIENSCHGQSPP